jgi:hypothetical protein
LTATGPGAVTTGSSTAIPVITTDAYGRVSTATTAAVIAPAGTLSGATLNATVTASSLTSVGTLTGGTWNASVIGGTYGGTGVNNGANTLTLSGSYTLNQSVASGASPTFTGTNFTSIPAANLSGSTLASGVTASSLTSVGTLTSLTVSGTTTVPSITHSGTSGTGDIGASGAAFGTVWATATSAKYADLAENYQGDRQYNPGTVLMFGGDAEVTLADADTTRVAGVVSTNPAHLMNGQLMGPTVVALALQGRVPCQVIGPVQKGDLLVSAGFGYAKTNNSAGVGQVIGKALENYPMHAKGVVEVVVGRF